MHVADVTMFYAARGGGIRSYVDAKRMWLRARGGHHTLLVPGANGCASDPCTIGLRSVPLPFSHGYRVPLGTRSTVNSLVSLKLHLVEAEDAWHLAWAVLRARDALQIPAVAFCHSNVPRWLAMRCGRNVERGAIRYCRALYRHFDLVLAPSAHLTTTLQSWGIERVQHQPLGVDLSIFNPRRRTTGLRERMGISERSRVLVYAGRFAAEKNLVDLTGAMRRLGPCYVLLLVGAGALPADLPANVRVIDYV
ncbi:MAG TPA: glycosyltransferase, partial [Burkholderiales bacterium]|nr:glycosyltransferase [Burkholderiales bacterium]